MKVPTQWSEVRLKQYIEVSEIAQVDMDELDKNVKILSVLTGRSEDEVMALNLTELKEAVKAIRFIYTQPKTEGIRSSIRIKGNRFHINNKVNELTGGEYITFTSLLKDRNQITANIPQILSLFFKPVNFLGLRKKACYTRNDKGVWIQNLESYDKTAQLIQDHLTMDVVMELSGFFLRNYQILIKSTQDYLIKMTEKNRKMILKEMGLPSTGRGI